MSLRKGVRVLTVVRASKAHLYGNWYKDKIGQKFSALKFSIMANEYTVIHEGNYLILRAEDVTEEDMTVAEYEKLTKN